MTTVSDLINADLKEYGARRQRYFESSSLSFLEKIKNKPQFRKYPRDRILHRLLRLNMNFFTKTIANDIEGIKNEHSYP